MIGRVYEILNEVCSNEHFRDECGKLKVMLDVLEDAKGEFGGFGFRAGLGMLLGFIDEMIDKATRLGLKKELDLLIEARLRVMACL